MRLPGGHYGAEEINPLNPRRRKAGLRVGGWSGSLGGTLLLDP
jgi:hypothetical protein